MLKILPNVNNYSKIRSTDPISFSALKVIKAATSQEAQELADKLGGIKVVSYKDGIESYRVEVFDKSDEIEALDDEIKKTKAKIASVKNKIKELEDEYNRLFDEYNVKRTFCADCRKKWSRVYELERADIVQNPESTTYLEEQNKAYKLFRAADKESKAAKTRVNSISNALNFQKQYLKGLETYLSHLQEHPKTAFMYNPDLSPDAISSKISRNSNIIPIGYSDIEGLEALAVKFYCDINVLKGDVWNNNTYIDISYPQNQDFIKRIKEDPDSFVLAKDLISKYNFSEGELTKLSREGRLIPLGEKFSSNYDFYIDLSDPINRETFEKHLKTTPVPSRKYYKSLSNYSEINVAGSYLARLGFATQKQLHEAILKGEIKGEVKKVQRPDGKSAYSITVDISSNDTERKLQIMRDENKSLVDVKQFAKMLKIKQKDVSDALISGELEIVPEYIFSSDYKYSFINLKNPKNAQFIDKVLFERELERQIRKTNRQNINSRNSLRMKLVWHFCPETRRVAADVLRERPWVEPILDKKEEEGEEALSEKEKTGMLSYFKNMWLEAGTEEFIAARKKAKEVLEAFDKSGLSVIDDNKIREIFLDYQAATN